MECNYRYDGPYKPVSYTKKDCCKRNELRNELARNAFLNADSVQAAYLELGKSAVFILYKEGNDARVISTSAVEDISEHDGTLQITTRNSVYVMALSDAVREHRNEN